MAKTLGGKIAKFVSVLFAAMLVLVMSLAFVGCESKRPEISVRISFNDKEYTLEYELYRNMYPQTVAHYLELIDMDYFDGTVIHDYQSARMVGGGYYYEGSDVDVADDLIEKDYDAATKDENGNVTLENISVWEDADKERPYNTLYGEFEDNRFTIENNGLSETFGSIGTYYYTPANTSKKIYVQRNEDGEMDQRPYCYNATTSLFSIYTGSTGNSTAYCTFGLLKEDDEQTLQDLLDAIEEYTLETLNGGDEEGTETFTVENQMNIEDEYWEESVYEDVVFNIPRAQIVIEEIRVIKY